MKTCIRAALLLVFITEGLSAQSAQSIRTAVSSALPLLEHSAGEFVSKRACVSCHHNILPILMIEFAKSRGFDVDANVLRAVQDKTFRELRGPGALEQAIQATNLNDPTPNDSYLLTAAHAAGVAPDLATSVYAHRLVHWQRDGHWITSDFRPPHSSSVFTATATAVRAITFYIPEELSGEGNAAVEAARRWLVENRPASTEDGAFRLMGLVWAGASRDQIASGVRDLTAMQKSDGGWPQISGYDSDAYSTGEALFALFEAGARTNAAFMKGLKFLISTQSQDGTWRVRTRMLSPADVSPEYFQTGFPYGKDEFLSYAGTCWAVMALASALPETATTADSQEAHTEAPASAGAAYPSWLRVALFGTTEQLRALLDRGLDPNSRTANGTTVLMAAAPHAEKVRLLLSRGADAKARASSGVDALTIAAAYRGAAESVGALVHAGAEVQPPEGVRLRHAPIALASMSGDVEIVKLLLAGGAEPTPDALGEAVTFGYPDVAKQLIGAGASANLTESSGVNLLHWAAITNRPDLVPVLAGAGAPVNAMDDNGFTPLMYAATIDFGDTAVLKALLKAGADKTIRNFEGKTPLDLARQYKHSRLEAALR